MKVSEALRKVMELRDVRVAMLCDRLNMKSNAVCNRLKQENISIDKLNETLRVMDYKVIILPREVRTPAGGIDID